MSPTDWHVAQIVRGVSALRAEVIHTEAKIGNLLYAFGGTRRHSFRYAVSTLRSDTPKQIRLGPSAAVYRLGMRS